MALRASLSAAITSAFVKWLRSCAVRRLLDEGEPGAGARLPVVTNVGRRPTFLSGGNVLAEAHVIDWNGDLYGRRVELSFEHRLRAERKFAGVEALKQQIQADVAAGRKRLGAV